jgi:hypothetical protein
VKKSVPPDAELKFMEEIDGVQQEIIEAKRRQLGGKGILIK